MNRPKLMSTTYSYTAQQMVDKLTEERDLARKWWEYLRDENARLQYRAGLAEGEAAGLRQALDVLKLAVQSLRERAQELEQQQVEVATKTPAAAVVPALFGNGPSRG